MSPSSSRRAVCPLCGNGEISLFIAGAIVMYPVYMENGKPFVDWSQPYIDDSEDTEAYVCEHCGEQVALHIDELAEILNAPGSK